MPDITAARPTAGAPIESAWGGQVHDALESILGARQASGPTASYQVPYNVFTAVPQLVLTGVPAGLHLVLVAMDLDSTATGFGAAQAVPFVDGVQAPGPLIEFMAAAAGHRVTGSQVWLVTVTGAGTVEVRAMKTANAGQVQAVLGRCTLTVL
jgi:hypothetical protein